jgi:hypothetical protein
MSDRAYVGSQPVGQASSLQTIDLGDKQVVFDSKLGRQEYVYIQNGDVSTIDIGMLVQHKTADANGHVGIICVTAKTPKWQCLGIAQTPIPAGYFGWILCDGVGLGVGDGAVSADSAVMSNGTAGRFTNATITNLDEAISVAGVATTADAAAGTVFTIRASGY